MGEQIKNLNFTIRYNICRDLHRSVIETDDMAKSLEEYTNKLAQLDVNESVVNLDCLDGNTIITFEGKNQIEQYLSLVSQIVYIDAYKYYSFREKKSLSNDAEVFDFIKSIDDYEKMSSIYKTNPAMFAKMLAATYDFYSKEIYDRIIKVRSLKDKENEKLLNMCPIHGADLEHYGKQHQLDIDEVMRIYSTRFRVADIVGMETEEEIVEAVVRFIRELCAVDSMNALKLCIEIADRDYIFSNYVGDEELREHVEFYEHNFITTIVTKLLCDREFLKRAIKSLADMIVHREYKGRKIDILEVKKSKEELIDKLNLGI